MNYEELRNDESFFEWHKYSPMDVQYLRYADSNPSVVAVGHKIEDVFSAFANARGSFMFADSDDFGDISGKDDDSRLYAKTHFLTMALIEYAICLDISWQVAWAYIQPASLEYLMKQKYKEMEKECNRDSVMTQLNCAISQHSYEFSKAQSIKNVLIAFDNDEDTLKLRSIYNAIKHQGSIHFDGLGANFTGLLFSVNGKIPPMLHRKSYTVEEIENLLFSYHCKFEIYMNQLISIIIPSDYLENTMGFIDALNQLLKINGSSE